MLEYKNVNKVLDMGMYRQHASVHSKRTEGERKRGEKELESYKRSEVAYKQICTSLKSPRKGVDIHQHYQKGNRCSSTDGDIKHGGSQS